MSSRRHVALAILSVAPFAVALAVIRPFGNVFYGGDDWAYAWSVQTFVNTEHLHISEWTSAAAVPQILWGAVFVRVFGWSAAVLNLSTAAAALVGGLALFQLLTELGFGRRSAVLSTIVVTTSSLYLGMAGSFMSDAMYTSLMLVACACYSRALRLGQRRTALLGGLLCSGALLSRQIGVVLLLAYGLAVASAFVLSKASSSRRRLFLQLGAWGGLVPLVVFALYRVRPEYFGGQSIAQQITIHSSAVLRTLLNFPRTLILGLITYEYVIVLLLPMLLPLLAGAPNLWRHVSASRRLLLSGIALVLVTAHALWFWRTGVFLVEGDALHVNPRYGNDGDLVPGLWAVLAGLSMGPGAVLLAAAWDALRSAWKNRNRFGFQLQEPEAHGRAVAKTLVVLLFIGHMILTAGFTSFYNNYFLPLMPLCAACTLLLFQGTRFRVAIAALPIVVAVLVSVLYIENHARFVEANWKTADALVRSGNDAQRVFAWPSWYGWNHYDSVINDLRTSFARGDGVAALRIFGRAHEGANVYVVGSTRNELFGKIPVVDFVKYHTLLGDRALYVLQRTGDKLE